MIISELRKNPDKNIKKHVLEVLQFYKEKDDNYYIHFSNLPKVGINPKSTFKTPLGIYGYNLSVMWDDIKDMDIPFAGERKYIILFKSKGNNIAKSSEYGSSELKRDIDNIKKVFKPLFVKMFRIQKHHKFISSSTNVYVPPTNEPYQDDLDFQSLYKQDKDVGMKDMLKRKVAKWKEEQKGGEDVPRIRADIAKRSLEELGVRYNKFVDDVLEDWMEYARSSEEITKFWNITRHLGLAYAYFRRGKEIYDEPTEKMNKGSYVMWNHVLRQLGYNGFDDDLGLGFIHENEPQQAVFMSLKDIEVVKILDNTMDNFNSANKKSLLTLNDIVSLRKTEYHILFSQMKDLLKHGESRNFVANFSDKYLLNQVFRSIGWIKSTFPRFKYALSLIDMVSDDSDSDSQFVKNILGYISDWVLNDFRDHIIDKKELKRRADFFDIYAKKYRVPVKISVPDY